MDELEVAPGETVVLGFGGVTVRVTQHMYDALRLLRHRLKEAARRGETLTYGEAAAAMNHAYLPQRLGRVLDVLSEDCIRRGEPLMAALVVRKDAGEVGTGFLGNAAAERAELYRYWSTR